MNDNAKDGGLKVGGPKAAGPLGSFYWGPLRHQLLYFFKYEARINKVAF